MLSIKPLTSTDDVLEFIENNDNYFCDSNVDSIKNTCYTRKIEDLLQKNIDKKIFDFKTEIDCIIEFEKMIEILSGKEFNNINPIQFSEFFNIKIKEIIHYGDELAYIRYDKKEDYLEIGYKKTKDDDFNNFLIWSELKVLFKEYLMGDFEKQEVFENNTFQYKAMLTKIH